MRFELSKSLSVACCTLTHVSSSLSGGRQEDSAEISKKERCCQFGGLCSWLRADEPICTCRREATQGMAESSRRGPRLPEAIATSLLAVLSRQC